MTTISDLRLKGVPIGFSDVADVFDCLGAQNYAGDTGTANNVVLSIGSASVTAPVDGMLIQFRANALNTGATTLNLNGSGALPLVDSYGKALTPQVIVALRNYIALYAANINSWVLLNPSQSWVDWTPTYGALAPMTITPTSTPLARYVVVGDTVHFKIRAVFNLGGAVSSQVNFTLPINMAAPETSGSNSAFWGYILDAGGRPAVATSNGAGTVMNVNRFDLANWNLGTGKQFWLSGEYRRV